MRTTLESNLEQLLVFKATDVEDPQVEHLKCVDDPQVQSETTPQDGHSGFEAK